MTVKNKQFVTGLASWFNSRPEARQRAKDAGSVAFIAVKQDVQAALDAGYSMKTVWAYLHEQSRILGTYEAFRRHVRKHGLLSRSRPSAAEPMQAEATTPEKQPPKEKKFEFNPTPNKKELI
ncbi:MAG: TraK family protein [Azoarcus sp.]|jgi:hypothetical protein|nr:TraK family protein [Azoarcus sp.]